MTFPGGEIATEAHPPRGAGKWVALLIVWSLGAVSWMIYIGLAWSLIYYLY